MQSDFLSKHPSVRMGFVSFSPFFQLYRIGFEGYSRRFSAFTITFLYYAFDAFDHCRYTTGIYRYH